MPLHTSGAAADTLKTLILKAGDPRLSEALDDPPSEGYTMLLVGDHDQFVIDGSHIEIAAIVRRLAVEARHRFAGSGVSTTPEYSLPVYAIATQLQYAGHVPDEDGALLAAGQMVDYLRGAGYDVITRPDELPPPEPSLPVLWPSADVTAELLGAGRTVQRYVERSRGGRWMAQVPCCDRWARMPDPPDDGPAEDEPEQAPVVCNPCKILYTVELQEEGDDGWGPSWLAAFTVAHVHVTTATRNYRKATTS